MRRRHLLLLPFAALAILAGVLGWRAGQVPDEGAILEHYAARWEALGGARTDCTGQPGTGEVRMVVTCGSEDQRMVWRVDERGREITGGGPEA